MEAGIPIESKKKIKWLRYLVYIIPVAPLLAIILVPLHPSHALFRQYFATVVTWPAVVLTIGLILLLKYHQTISFCLKKLLIRTPQGYEIRVDQDAAQPPENAVEKSGLPTIPGQKIEAVLEHAGFMVASEWTVRYMFRSQFRLLKSLEQQGFIDLPGTIKFYNEYLGQGGIQSYKVENYIGWLAFTMKLVELKIVGSEYRYYLTERGSRFLKYCEHMGYTEYEFKPL